jgi:hypothetical protein
MRAQLWEVASAECRRIKAEVEAALHANTSSIEAIAQRLVNAPDLTLSGPVLASVLGELDLVLPSGATGSPKGAYAGKPK